MTIRTLRDNWRPYLAAIVVAASLKTGYSVAGAGELRWILGPTAWLADVFTRRGFAFEDGAGYVSADGGIVIAPVCAGVNFLIICFCMLAFSHIPHVRRPAATFGLLIGLALVSYVVTVLVNAARIAVSIQSLELALPYRWLSSEGMHRLEGVSIYFLSLSLLYIGSQEISHRVVGGGNGRHLGRLTLAAPLFWYFLVTVGIPLVRISYGADDERFIEHVRYVILVPALMVLAYAALRRGLRAFGPVRD